MNNVLSVIVGVALVVGVGGFVFWQKSVNEAAIQQPDQSTQIINTTTGASVISNTPSNTIDDSPDEVEAEDDGVTVNPPQNATVPSGEASGGSGITAAIVATHASRASCWTIINGNVYDLTSWIPKHPGGEQAILQLCGIDGSAKFNRKHGGDAPKEKVLFGFKVGALAQ